MRSVVKTASGRALYDRSFQSRLDGEDYRRLVMTSDGFLINTINMTVTPANKDVVITKSLGIPYPRELFAVLDELNLEGVLQEVAEYESKLGPKYVEADVPDALKDKLLRVFDHPSLEAVRVLYSCWENMSTLAEEL